MLQDLIIPRAGRLNGLMLTALIACLCGPVSPVDAQTTRRTGPVRVDDHALADRDGPFLGMGISYFTALWRYRHDRPRLESDLAFLSRQGFNYYRMLSMVGWHPAWDGKEIAPVTFTSRDREPADGKRIQAWPDYWRQLGELIDLAYDHYGLRTQITIFADAQLIPDKQARIAHMRSILNRIVPGREHKIILLEVANEAWQNGFPGKQGVADLREFTRFLADRTNIPVATTSNHEDEVASLYANSAADIATWHFSRDRRTDDGWKPVYDCWDYGNRPGFPPASSNEPIGPGSSVAAENDPARLVMAAAFAYAAKLPMYVFHCEAGVFGKSRFEDTPGIVGFGRLKDILPADLPNWQRNDGKEKTAIFTAFAAGQPNRYWPELRTGATTRDREPADGCVRNTGARKGNQFVCVPIGIRKAGLTLEARENVDFRVLDPLTAKVTQSARLRAGERLVLPAGRGGWIVVGRVVRL